MTKMVEFTSGGVAVGVFAICAPECDIFILCGHRCILQPNYWLGSQYLLEGGRGCL